MINFWFSVLPLAALTGWCVGRNDQSTNGDTRKTRLPRDYLVGLNYLLNEEADKAVDVFIKVLEVDSDTVETHLALGNLFRRRGEVSRAIRVHQNLIARPNLTNENRTQALLALGQDYMSAGVLDRAERILVEVVETQNAYRVDALRHLLDIYQQEKSWQQAIAIAKRLSQESNLDVAPAVANFYCELAEIERKTKQMDIAKSYIKKALATDKQCVRASLALGQFEQNDGRYKSALKAYDRVRYQDPDFIPEIVEPIEACYAALNNEQALIVYLDELLAQAPSYTVVIALTKRLQRRNGIESANNFLVEQLKTNPSLRGVSYLLEWHIQHIEIDIREKFQVIKELISKLLETKPIYRCFTCGTSGKTLLWLCPRCKIWGSVKPIHGLEGD